MRGDMKVGDELSCYEGEWTGTPEIKYVFLWLREGTPIAGATESTYHVQPADEGEIVACRVTATNAVGSTYVTSIGLPIPKLPASTVAPGISGVRKVGDTLTCSSGAWSGTQDFTYVYQWESDGTPILGASKETYAVQAEDEGKTLSCMVTAENEAGSATATSGGILVPVLPLEHVLPQVHGNLRVGDELSCYEGDWSGTQPITFAVLWLREGAPIPGATESTYHVQFADEGKFVACQVVASNEAGESKPETSVAVPVPVLPLEYALPQVTGTARVGDTLECATGEWTGTTPISYSREWLLDGVAIAGEVQSTYKVRGEDEGHVLSCQVAASNEAGESKPARSVGVSVPVLPVNTVLPQVTGMAKVGQTLECSTGEWMGTAPISYSREWLLDGVAIAGEVQSTYKVRGEDEGHVLSCQVVASNAAGESKSMRSIGVSVPNRPENVIAPEVSGGVRVGETLTCSKGTWTGVPTPTYAYKWLRDATAIPNATASTYKVQTADEGELVFCEVTATNSAGAESASSNHVRVPSLPESTTPPVILGEALAGETLSCQPGSWEGTPAPTFADRWLRDETPIAGATKASYEVGAADEGHTLFCEVTATNTAGSKRATSNGLPVPEEVRKQKEIITSVDTTKGDLAPYDGDFSIASQKFKAMSDTITYAGVTIGNPKLPVGESSSYKVDIRLCTTQECMGVDSELASVETAVDNYRLSAGEFPTETSVTPDRTYYLVWTPPPSVEGTKWLTFWHGGQATPIEKSEDMEAIVRGYNRASKGANVSNREIISYFGSKPPPAPYSDPFQYVYQNFVAASNRITTLGAVVGNPATEITKPPVPQELEIMLCTTATCKGSELAHGNANIVNYGVTEVHLEKAVDVTPGREYFVYWKAPAEYEATPWVAFWQGTGPEPEDATEAQAVVKGYDAGFETFGPTYFPETPETNGISTFKDYENASGEGQEIKEGEVVYVTCKIFAPEIPSVELEGYWYRIHSSPWNEEYYAVANSFLNGGGIGNPVYVDPKVPDC